MGERDRAETEADLHRTIAHLADFQGGSGCVSPHLIDVFLGPLVDLAFRLLKLQNSPDDHPTPESCAAVRDLAFYRDAQLPDALYREIRLAVDDARTRLAGVAWPPPRP